MKIFFRRIPSDTKPYELFHFIVDGLQDGISSQKETGSKINNIDILVQKDSELKTVWHHGLVTIEDNKIVKTEFVNPPPHELGSHPAFLRELGCDTILAGGMGSRAQTLFNQNSIEVIFGLQSDNLQDLIETYIKEGLQSGGNLCDH